MTKNIASWNKLALFVQLYSYLECNLTCEFGLIWKVTHCPGFLWMVMQRFKANKQAAFKCKRIDYCIDSFMWKGLAWLVLFRDAQCNYFLLTFLKAGLFSIYVRRSHFQKKPYLQMSSLMKHIKTYVRKKAARNYGDNLDETSAAVGRICPFPLVGIGLRYLKI